MKKLAIIAGAALAATPALAHHPLGGLPMTTIGEGVLSGVGHPVLGFDHLFFVLAVGVASAFAPRRLLTPLAYVAAMALGTMAVAWGAALPAAEAMIALSLLVVGGVALRGRALSGTAAMALFAAFGLFHGAGFAGSIAGTEAATSTVLVGYLAGLALVQYAIALAAGWAAARADRVSARLAGAAVAGVGAFLALEIVEGPLVALLAA